MLPITGTRMTAASQPAVVQPERWLRRMSNTPSAQMMTSGMMMKIQTTTPAAVTIIDASSS